MYHSRIAGNAAKRSRRFSYVYVDPHTLFVCKTNWRFSQFSTDFLSKGLRPVPYLYGIEEWGIPSAARNANSKHRQIYVLLVSQCFLGTKNTFYFWWFQRSDQDTNFLMANNDLPNLDIYCYLYNIKFWTSNIMKNRNQYSVMILNLN